MDEVLNQEETVDTVIIPEVDDTAIIIEDAPEETDFEEVSEKLNYAEAPIDSEEKVVVEGDDSNGI